MKFYPSLLILTGISTVLGFALFFGMYRFSGASNNDMGVLSVLGWPFWLGLVAIIGPQCFSDDTRTAWFSRGYLWGTLLLLLANVFLTILCNFMAYSLVSPK